MWLQGMYDYLELESEYLERLGIGDVDQNKDKLVLLAEFNDSDDLAPGATALPSIWSAERYIDRTPVETVNFQECFILFAMQSPICYDNIGLAKHINFPKPA